MKTRRRTAIGGALLLCAFIASLFFHGSGTNLVVLWGVAGLMLAGASALDPSRLRQELEGTRLPTGLAIVALVYLALAYQWSLSKEFSHAATWVLASIPIAYFLGRFLESDGFVEHVFERAVFGIVLLFALVNCVRFFGWQERAQFPLLDPNNYGALTYAVWIVFLFRSLDRWWSDVAVHRGERIATYVASALFLVAILATRSRACALVVLGVLLLGVLITTIHRRSVAPVAIHAALAAVAYALVTFVEPAVGAKFTSADSLQGGIHIRSELLRSAWQMFVDYPVGAGIFCFSLLYPEYRSVTEQETTGLFVHNDYLQLLAEGGPVLLVVVLVWIGLVVVVFLRNLRTGASGPGLARFGYAAAILACAAHAILTFTLYTLPIAILLGVLSARLAPRTPANASVDMRFAIPIHRCAMLFGWIAWLYLALDVGIHGVFQGQSYVPGAAWVRESTSRQLEFARIAQRLNANRSMPVLAEAVILRGRAVADPTSVAVQRQAEAKLHEAVAADPRNPLGYLELADFLERFPGERSDHGTSNELRELALSLDPAFIPGIDALLAQHLRDGAEDDAYALLKERVFPWLQLIEGRNTRAAAGYLAQLAAFARSRKDLEALTRIEVVKKRFAAAAERESPATKL